MSSTEKIPARQLFSDRLRARRIELGLKGKEMAEKLGCAAPVYSRYEHGRVPDTVTVSVIADLLGVTVEYLLGRAVPNQTYPVPGDAAASAMLLRERPDDTGSRLSALERRVAAIEQALVRLVAGNPTGGDT